MWRRNSDGDGDEEEERAASRPNENSQLEGKRKSGITDFKMVGFKCVHIKYQRLGRVESLQN